MRFAGMMLPGNAVRTMRPFSRRAVAGSKIWMPWREQRREVAVALRLGRHGELRRLGELIVEPLDGGEEERLVLEDRAAEHAAEALVVERRLGTALPFEEEVVRAELLVAIVIVAFAAEAVGAALERHVDGGAGGVALLRVEVGGLDLEFLNGAGRRHERDAAAVAHVGRAVERELIAARRAIGVDVGGAAVVERARELEVAEVGDAGGEAGEHERVAVGERHQRDALFVDDLAGRSAARFEERRGGADRDDLFDRADLEL